MRGFSRLGRTGWRGLIALAALPAVVACGAGAPATPTAPAAAPTARAPFAVPTTAVTVKVVDARPSAVAEVGPSDAVESRPAATATPALPAISSTPLTPVAPPVGANGGIVFGPPVLFQFGGMTTVGVLATNTTEQVKSFTVKATFEQGDKVAGTASGSINDLRPGQTRVASLVSAQPMPPNASAVRVDVDAMVLESATTPGAAAAARIAFGQPNVRAQGGLTTVSVEATNGDAQPHSFTVQAAFLKGDALVAVASGVVNDLAAGQSKAAALLSTGPVQDYDRVVVTVDTLVR